MPNQVAQTKVITLISLTKLSETLTLMFNQLETRLDTICTIYSIKTLSQQSLIQRLPRLQIVFWLNISSGIIVLLILAITSNLRGIFLRILALLFVLVLQSLSAISTSWGRISFSSFLLFLADIFLFFFLFSLFCDL